MDVSNFGRGVILSSWFSRCKIVESFTPSSGPSPQASPALKKSNQIVPKYTRALEVASGVQFPDISKLALDCTVGERVITLATSQSAQCVSIMAYHNNVSDSRVPEETHYLSCVSGYQRACLRDNGCTRAFFKCQGEWEGGSQFLEGNWKDGDAIVDVLSIFERGNTLGSWAGSCKMRSFRDFDSEFTMGEELKQINDFL